jgi:hypothetical protein
MGVRGYPVGLWCRVKIEIAEIMQISILGFETLGNFHSPKMRVFSQSLVSYIVCRKPETINANKNAVRRQTWSSKKVMGHNPRWNV